MTKLHLNRRSFLRLGALAGLTVSQISRNAMASGSGALANVRERSLSFYNLHTAENLKTVYWADGDYLPESLAAINHHLRDYRTGEVREIDRRLLDILCELRMKLDTTSHLEVISGYRSAATNAMLHERSDGVAQHSLHVEGMAADIRIPQRSLSVLRKAAISMKAGGVGYYPASDFVHVDTGRVRTW
jgi:uncharacterized protein YcbK (DUF882 family)